MQVWNVLHTSCWKYRMQKLRKKSPSAHHRTDLLLHIFATRACTANRKKSLLNSNISSKCSQNMVNFGPLMAEIGWWVLGTPANFNEFCVLASLVHRCRWTEVNHTLHDVWPSRGLVHYVYIFGGCCPLMEFCQVQNSLGVQVLHYPISAVLLHGTRAVGISQTLWHGIFTRQGGYPIWHWAVELSSLVVL